VSLDLDRAFTSELTRPAAAHLCDRLEALSADPGRATIPRGAHRGARGPCRRHPRPQAALESAALTLELTRLDREISATRAAGTGEVALLVSRRQGLRDREIALAIEQTQPPSDSRPPVMRTCVPARLAWG
jgi:hypothetical protein